ncbi:hypothetical protein [Brucella intermedia]|uniref:hypothetical protein n=1 Tax=Brucella intermedia TaxID=94625 RepID=UPI0023622ACF|nr:hypothetical protein [Brucella intermedia]
MRLTKTKLAYLRTLELEDALAEIAKLREEYNAYNRDYRKRRGEEGRAKHAANMRAWRKKNPKASRSIARRWRENHPEAVREERRKYKETRKKKGRTPQELEAHKEHNRRWYSRSKAVKYVTEKPEEARRIIAQQLPGYLTADAKRDITNEAITAILSRNVLFEEIGSCAKPFVTAYNRMFDQFKNISIDAPIKGTEDLRLIDLVPADAFHF